VKTVLVTLATLVLAGAVFAGGFALGNVVAQPTAPKVRVVSSPSPSPVPYPVASPSPVFPAICDEALTQAGTVIGKLLAALKYAREAGIANARQLTEQVLRFSDKAGQCRGATEGRA
jgi:hypothetical protein